MSSFFRGPRSLVALLAGGALLAARPAAADPAAEARFHDDLARHHYDRGDFEAAVREFFLEERLAPNPRIVFNIALCFEELRRDQDAFLYFSEYLGSEDHDPGRRSHAESTLAKLERRVARILVKSTPPGGDVFVDQQEHGSYGTTPRVVAVQPGEHTVFVSLPGYRTAEAKTSVKKGEQVEVTLAPVRIVGTLAVASPVPGQVLVNTPEGEQIAQGSTPFSAALPPGTYEVTVRAKGYLPWTAAASVEADGRTQTTALPQPAPAETGDITVTSNVTGALVELDGQPVGFSPTVLARVPVGPHKLLARAPSVLPWSGTVDVASEKREWVTVSLEAPAKVERSSATWVAGGLGVAGLAAAGVFAVLAAKTHGDFEAAGPGSDRASLHDRGVAYDTAADVLLISGAVALTASAILYFTTAETHKRESSASISRSAR
jgi:hypothetical protein